MPRIIEASCAGGVVTVQGFVVPGVEILSKGIGSSDGALIIDEDRSYYISSRYQDLEDILDQLNSTLDQLVTTLTTINGVTSPPGTATSDIAQLAVEVASLYALKEVLR